MGSVSPFRRFRCWLAGLCFLLAGKLDAAYDVWLDDAPPRHAAATTADTAPTPEHEPRTDERALGIWT